MQLMLWGYIQKMVIADRAAVLVDYVYGNAEQFYGITLLTASLFYSCRFTPISPAASTSRARRRDVRH